MVSTASNQEPDLLGGDPRVSDEPGLDLLAAARVLRRRWWFVAGAIVICLVTAALWTARSPRIFQASSLLIIEMHAPKVLNQMSEVYDLGVQGYWNSMEYYETQYKVIQGRTVAQRAAAKLGITAESLAEDLRALGPEAPGVGAVESLQGVPEELRRRLTLVGLHRLPSRQAMLDALEHLDPAAVVQSRLSVIPVKDSRLVRVAVEDRDPQNAALMAEAVVDAYIQFNLDQKIDTTQSAVDWLSAQKADLKAKLEASELALHRFKEENRIIAVSLEDRQSMIAQTLMQLNEKLSSVRAERLALESKVEQLEKRVAANNADAVSEVINDKVIQGLKAQLSELKQEEVDLRTRYTDEHPKVIAVRGRLHEVESDLRAQVSKIVTSVQGQHQTTRQTERRLEDSIEELKAEALKINKKEIEYNRLQRERDNNLELYQIVLKRQKEANLARMLNVNNVRKLEAALVPEVPIKPRAAVNMVMALLIGIVLGIGLAFGADYLDNRIKTQEHIEQAVGLPFLGIIPTIKPDTAAPAEEPSVRDHFIIRNPRSSVAECCRSIRTNLLFMSPENPVRSLLVTSGRPREGKSTTSVNLGITMAQAGAKVVIVDTDMRRPRLHKSFGISGHTGISSVIVGEAELDHAIQSSGIDNLDVIACGPIPPNPAELLHTERFRHLLRELSERYDRVLFDSPPIHAVTDGLVLASMVEGVVLVAQAGQTSIPEALQAKRRLLDVNGRIFGVILNEVDLDGEGRTVYYDYYYHAGYGEDVAPKPSKA